MKQDVRPAAPKSSSPKDSSVSIIHINEHELDKECVRLPAQFHQAAWQAGETARDIEEVRAELHVKQAEVNLAIRNSPPDKFGLDKFSEASIKEIACMDPKIRALEKKIRDLEYKHAMEKVLVTAMDYKKRALSNLVDLHAAGWFAQVRPSGAGKQTLDQISRQRIAKPMPWKQRQDDKEE
jgi:hypothetical protein